MRFFVGRKLATLARNFIKYTLSQDIKNFVTCPQKTDIILGIMQNDYFRDKT